MTNFSAWDLTDKEDKVLSILLKAQRPVSVRDIYGKLQVTRYYVYEILKRLKDLELAEELNSKPKKFAASVQMLRKKLTKMDTELDKYWHSLQTAPREEIFTHLGLNETEQAILVALADAGDKQLTILEIKDQVKQSKSLVERYLKTLRSRKFVKRTRGNSQSYIYTNLAFNKIVEVYIHQEQAEWAQKRARLETQVEQFSGTEKPRDFLDLTLRELQSRLNRQTWLNILKEIPTSIKTPREAPIPVMAKREKAFSSIDDGHIIF
jgi:predicted transcriptional regulator